MPTYSPAQTTIRTTLYVDNLHCQSCVTSIAEIVARFSLFDAHGNLDTAAVPVISDVDISLPQRTVSFTHPKDFDLGAILKQLDVSGFDVRLRLEAAPTSAPGPSRWRSLLAPFTRQAPTHSQRETSHKEICATCRASENTEKESPPHAVSIKLDKENLRQSRFALEGMSCSSCASSISAVLAPSAEAGIRSCEVTLLPPAVLVVHDPHIISVDDIRTLIDEAGYSAELVTSKKLSPSEHKDPQHVPSSYMAVFSILGMTCAACTSSVTRAMETVPGTTSASVDLLGKTGSVVVRRKEDVELVKNEVEDVGFECFLVSLTERDGGRGLSTSGSRTVILKIGGMFCVECVNKVNNMFASLSQTYDIVFSPLALDPPTMSITYVPQLPRFTLRYIREEIASLGFTLSVVHVDSAEERAARARLREQRRILLRFIITLLFAIPTFVVAVVGMSLVSTSSRFRQNLEMPLWGNASEGTVILFALATPVQFGIGWFFYERAWKSIKGVWRRRSGSVSWRAVWHERLFRWGSMDTLVSLGTSAGYFASLALMVLDVRTTPVEGKMGGEMGWFDSSVFLILFILAGRYLESVSKQRTGDAIAALSATKPSTGLLYSPATSSTITEEVDFLEVGDTLLVPAGSSPPLDAVLTESSPNTSFDESSLTGEARPVLKTSGEDVFAGTINAGPAAAVVTVTREVGNTMLDGIVGVVRDAMGKKPGIARIADTVTGYFVPFVFGIATLTFSVWCLRGYLGGLPAEWAQDQRRGGWALFAVQFGVAVLVVACPCGIGLAAPTAQMVGIGLAAQQGILSNGGGEAFQTISSLKTVVLDKTGTLTTGKFTVSDHIMFTDSALREMIFSMLLAAEQASTHPLAVGVREWCQAQLSETAVDKTPVAVELISSTEMPGRGILGILGVDGHYYQVEVAIGNERLMDDVGAEYREGTEAETAKANVLTWQMAGKSVVFLSARLVGESPTTATAPVPTAGESRLPPAVTSETHIILGVFGVHDPPRPESSALVAELRRLHMEVWMISGDNQITAQTVAESVGIEKSHVIAGALPTDKQTWVKRLQEGDDGLTIESSGTTTTTTLGSTPRKSESAADGKGRTVVAFCGDGINDAPAIAQADVGLAMGGGSNVAISTADFCLLNSNLLSILTIHHLARATRRKIISNFVWACLYNVSLIPLAAGAFYALHRTTLPPVWGSAAMALSSVSVVVNSLFLRWTYSPPKAVKKWNRGDTV